MFTFNANFSCPDILSVSWHTESRMYKKCVELKSSALLLMAILYPKTKSFFSTDRRNLRLGNGHRMSEIVL